MNKITKSLWLSEKQQPFPLLPNSISSDICIIGAGISGLSIAYALLKEGKKVIVLDKEAISKGESSLTTAHLSSALDDRFFNIEKWIGLDGAKKAAESHAEAINQIEKIIQLHNIDCDFKRVSGYLFQENEGSDLLKKEEISARNAGLQVELVEEINPLVPTAALKFSNQAQFHITKYIKGLIKAIIELGGEIYGNVHISEILDGEPITLKSLSGETITCNHLIVAANSPIHHQLALHTKESSYRSYVIGLKIPKDKFPDILLWDTSEPYHYVRKQALDDEYDVLIVGGEDHRVGQADESEEMFLNLSLWCQKTLNITGEFLYKWSGQIIETLDGLAYIGKSPIYKGKVYEVSGDSGHGITHGVIASILIPDLISHRPNLWEKFYSPSRKSVHNLKAYVEENFKGAAQNIKWVLPGEKKLEDILPGEGAVIQKGCFKVAAFRDEKGKVHELSAACPHLGALVKWNDLEKTWDCPFHGSRFDKRGSVINGPSLTPLKK